MVREFTRIPVFASGTIITLANADFAKTKSLANRFDRPEVRLLARMMVLRTILDNKPRRSESADEHSTETEVASDGLGADTPPPPPMPRKTPF